MVFGGMDLFDFFDLFPEVDSQDEDTATQPQEKE